MEAQAVEIPTPVSNETESKIETEATEKEVPKVDEKTPETPVTEPMTNGSSAPESPKEEIRQNGDSASIEEQAPTPVIPELVKPVEAVEVPSVESLPINGLKIEETVEEPKAVVENKPDVTSEVVPPQLVEAKSETVETEVCVAKEKIEMNESAETAPPPLPANPPPSSFTLFAESTMAPHLVDKIVVGDMPVVDIDASISSLPPPIPETDNVQQAISESNTTPVCENNPPIDNVLSASPNDNVQNQSSPIADEKQTDSSIIPNQNDVNTPLESASVVNNEIKEVVDSCVVSNVVENLAVVSAIKTETPAPEPEMNLITSSDNKVASSTDNIVSSDDKVVISDSKVVTSDEKLAVLDDKVATSDDKIAIPDEKVVATDNKIVHSNDQPATEVNPSEQEATKVSPAIEFAPISNVMDISVSDKKEVVEILEKPIEQKENISVESISSTTESNPANTNISETNVVNNEIQSSQVIISSTEIKNEIEVNSSSLPTEEIQKSSVTSLETVSNINLPVVESNPSPPTNISESPLPQRTPSDPDISDNALVGPSSDSFPPPPPPASCPESMTEFSVSESLPPPPSESSQPDTVLNSPTSEISDFPPKDLPSPVKTEQVIEQKDSLESEALPNIEPHVTETTSTESATSPPADKTTETTTSNHVAESPVEQKIEESQQVPPADTTPQVKTVSDVVDVPIVESAAAVPEPSADTVTAEE